MKKINAEKFEYVEYTGFGHSIAAPIQNSSDMLEWMYKQKRRE